MGPGFSGPFDRTGSRSLPGKRPSLRCEMLQKKVSKYKAAEVPEQLVLRTVDVAPPSQEQLMVVIEGKQKEAAVTEEVVSKDPQAHFSSESHTRAFQEAYKIV